MTRRTLPDGSWLYTDEQWDKAQLRMAGLADLSFDDEWNEWNAWNDSIRIEQIEDEIKALNTKLNGQKFNNPNVQEMQCIEGRIVALSTEKTNLLIRFAPAKLSANQQNLSASQQLRKKIEATRQLMQEEIDNNNWQRGKQGKEGLLGFVWRTRVAADGVKMLKTIWGSNIEYDSIRRMCTPLNCNNLGILPLPGQGGHRSK